MNSAKNQYGKISIGELAVCGMFTALTFVFTWLINVRLPIMGNGGLIHLGNVPLFVAAVLFGKRTGFIAGGIGMGLFDLFSGWTMWAPFTFIVVGLMGFTVGWITEKRRGSFWVILAFLAAGVIKVVGYYLAEGIIYGNWIAPLGSIPGNVIQVGFAALLVTALLPVLNTVKPRLGGAAA